MKLIKKITMLFSQYNAYWLSGSQRTQGVFGMVLEVLQMNEIYF